MKSQEVRDILKWLANVRPVRQRRQASREKDVRDFATYLATTCQKVVQREKLQDFATEFLAQRVSGATSRGE